MALIDEKIVQFRKEVGDKDLTESQRKVFEIFCKTKGHMAQLVTMDSQSRIVCLKIPVGRTSEGSCHILLKHYGSSVGRVIALEIVNITDVINHGVRSDDGGNHYQYKMKKKYGKVELTLGVKLARRGDILKSFYSNRRK